MPFIIIFILSSGFSLLQSQSLRIVPTFHCLGIYWQAPMGGENIKCHVNYRKIGQAKWQTAQDLWYDDRQISGRPREYRGSIVHLSPGTDYEIKLWLDETAKTEITATTSTWSEQFPINKSIFVSSTNQTFSLLESGSSHGYVLYTAAPNTTCLDVENKQDFCIYIPEGTHHVIIRGLSLRGAARHAIRLSDHCHDIVIEECDISQWGNADASGFGINLHAAISAPFRADHIERLIIQNNDIHHPRADANSWGEPRPNPGGDPYHPQGPYGMVLYDTRGNHVIRYNRFFTDVEHYFCDILGAGSNISFFGFPNKDSDIYGNSFERCWDDAIESEGANENVRIWDNIFDHIYHPIGAVVTSVGPMYIWRNITTQSRKFGHITTSDDYGRGEFIKCGGTWQDGTWYGDGRMYVYHNTILQPLATGFGQFFLGCEGAFVAEGKSLYNMVSRNNILTNYKMTKYTIRDNPEEGQCDRNDFDYDLYTGRIKETCPQVIYEKNGLKLASNDDIIYNGLDPAGPYALMPCTPGHDAGILLANFNDDYNGLAPDMGAIESTMDSLQCMDNGQITPQAVKLFQNSPNPFNGQTRILFFLHNQGYAEISIVDAAGRQVRSLVNRQCQQGYTAVVWDGRNQGDVPVASGVYFCRLSAHGYNCTQKLLLIR
ncbi:right-handed parallel beta-helix repeat-containing protein [candidate division KSB1 bacterium]|nr:right-handed parallel beta-helix repeat-containing protein [candidate division KSB1 bacterium]